MDGEEQLDSMPCSIEEIRNEFESYKVRYNQQLELNQKLLEYFRLDKEMELLNDDVQQLRMDMNKLQRMQLDLSNWQQPDAIVELPSSLGHTCSLDVKQEQEQLQLQAAADVAAQQLLISGGSSSCLFEHCQRRVDSQLLLLHYLSDHSDDNSAFLRCHRVEKGQRIVLSFSTRRCQLRQNEIIGLLAYNDSCPSRKQEMKSEDVPIVVLICKTAAAGTVFADKHKKSRNEVYVIWLVTPSSTDQLQMNATLSLCGRDAAVQAHTSLVVRTVIASQVESEFVPIDDNYWRLPHELIQKISNNFRDELHLKIGIIPHQLTEST